MKDGATLMTTAHFSWITLPVYILSLATLELDVIRLAALDVGTPKVYMASEQRNSLIEDLSTALPSALLEYGVKPAPLSCRSINWLSYLERTSPRDIARPSPSYPEKYPN